MFTRDLERMARSLVAQRLEPVYIRHYLSEAYQVDDATIDGVFARIGLKDLVPRKGNSAKKPK